ncbi:MAG TPA: DNA-processing protein DprA [bacterium]|nr:DNA-processing protein DprA [bacterium]
MGLSLLPGVGARTIRRWIERAGSAQAVWGQLPVFLQAGKNYDEVLTAWRELDPARVVADARVRGMSVVAQSDQEYPALLRVIPDPPPVLFVRGALADPQISVPPLAVAIVGSRRATPYGVAAARRLAFDLAGAGVTVTSGLARGVDAAAHQGALDGGGRTIAVLGSGGDYIYPPEHRGLADAIVSSGAVITELPPGTPPLASHFPRRNRIISGMSAGVVVVEGAADSGALVTVDCALDQGREVFAVPGSVFSEHSRAPHGLLRQGARIVESAGDILDELGLSNGTAASRSPGSASAQRAPQTGGAETDGETRLLDELGSGPRSLDDLVQSSGLAAGTVAALVTLLEVRGLIQVLPGQMVMRTPRRLRWP